jgi:hypothetical protein
MEQSMNNGKDLESFEQHVLDGQYDEIVEALEFRGPDATVRAWLRKPISYKTWTLPWHKPS